ncbi:hypothetical protein V9T40_000850 [Parthenolecanium corni]|uniref:Polycystin cation channel PKD1/PKD2 domain-containing protein n=1 Tax=Parthenolecanium corni TaxID=536013 RepID=A0AAN9TBR6_9HEMI
MNSPELTLRRQNVDQNKDGDETLIGNPCSSINSSVSDATNSLEARRLRLELRFFFQNPIQKWNARHRFPYKFLLQIIKIILVTAQLCIFAESRYNHMNYALNNKVTFSHLFVNIWDSGREVLNYPPVSGPLAVYQKTDFYESVNFAINRYGNLSDSIGPYSHLRKNNRTHPLELCICRHVGRQDLTNQLNEQCDRWNVLQEDMYNFSTEDFLKSQNFTLDFELLQSLSLEFPLLAHIKKIEDTRCSLFIVRIDYNNRNLDGQLLISLTSNLNKLKCPEDLYTEREREFFMDILNATIILICSFSLILCMRSIVRAQLLKRKTADFFRRVKGVELSMEGILEFWNFWFIMIIANDILIIIGSILERRISRNEYDSTEEWSFCSLCLGTGNMLVWFGVLRYFGFFKTYNVVILTLKRAFPKMARFLLCTLIIYAGFVFCGWLVLGPFHIKFRSISRTSENLFSLVNGDDMFATFTILDTNNLLLWYYERIYLYSFISLFIYVVLNLFLSVILDAYETIKEYYLHGFPKSDLQQFIYECESDPFSDSLIRDDLEGYDHGLWCFCKKIFNWIRLPSR